ncbi:MAG: ABC transporter ATP-binding protein [Gemmatimonadales bacterium]|nr:ABC transporter ATP-binding protein [Gemmatimonadales bacterium]MYG20293.1 ABC transporter ATP-binding protein [Gemmatimonadales bacterium]MYH10686.1 ABC transporter ATP-binding protein [Gemmatimonadales bacterium]MYL05545.1 ABC transporter ATP-binding protein [Gemmatimonadales bacterium]
MPEEAVARLSGVTHRYGAVVALEEVDVEVRRGEVLAVLGPNGAGKTTAISLLLGSVAVQAGKATVFGQRPGAPEVRARRGAMLQISGVPETLTIGEHIDLFRAYYPAPAPASRLLAMAGLEGLERRRFGKLSGGQKQRVMFALALCGDPQLVFLDEPTAGLDVEARRGLWEEIRALSESGRTTVLTTHYLEEADALADRIVVLHRGRVIAEGSPATIKSHTAARRVRCVTGVHRDRVASLPGVVRSETRGRHLEILTSRPEDLVRALLDLDPDLHDLTVVGAGLEEAFLALTRAPDASEPVS